MINTTLRVNKTDWVSILVTFLVLAWIVGVSLFGQGIGLFGASFPDQTFRRSDLTPPLVYLGAAFAQALALLLPLAPLALWWRAPRYRGAFRAWLAATLFLIVLSPARLILSTAPQLALLLQFALALIFSLALSHVITHNANREATCVMTCEWFITGRGKFLERASPTAIAVALAIGFLLALPWLVWGALGSIGDVALGILTALAFALAATLILTRVWLRGMAQNSRGTGWDITLGGFVIGALLLIMGSAIGFSGTQLLFMLALSAFGWLLMDLTQINFRETTEWNDAALFVLITLVIATPLLFLDPDAGILLASAGEGEVLGYAVRATGIVILSAWGLGLLFFFLRKQIAEWRRASFVWIGAAALGFIALAVYFTLGQPGFFGDRVFVILKQQADVSSAKTIADYNERRAFVYNTLTQHANQTQSDLRATLDGIGISYTPYYLVNALEVNADLPVQWWLATRSEVDRVLPSPRMRPLPQPPPISRGAATRAPTSPEWNLSLIGANRVWNELGVRGAGVVVGQSDSGVDGAHPEFSARYRGRNGNNDFNWLDPWNHTASPTDIGGHGTHTLGSIVGKTVGVAPDAEWIGCVNLARNLGNPALYLDCLQFMLAPYPQKGNALRDGDPKRGAHVLNNSWGCPDVEGCDPNTLLNAVRALRDAGVFVVASAGNDGPACSTISHPISLYDDVFSVGAIDRNRQLADFSSRGPVLSDGSGRVKPDISAPGVNVYSALPGGTYGANSGTSMAGPHITGIVALLWSANPNLIGDIDRTEQILRETAQRINVADENIVCGDPNATPNDFVGYGIVDAYAAVKRAIELK